MGTTYTGLKIKNTYGAIIKVGDNSNLTAFSKQLSDGLGNNTGLYVGTNNKLGIGISPTEALHVSGNATLTGDLNAVNGTFSGNITTLGIDDNATSNALTIDSNENIILQGTLTTGGGTGSGGTLNVFGNIVGSSDISFASLTDTGESITINKFVDEADGIPSNDDDSSIPTSAAVKDYVDTQTGLSDELSQVLAIGNTTDGTDIAVSANDDITLTSTSKLLLGDTNTDLQIYSASATDSHIKGPTSGNLTITSDIFTIQKSNGDDMLNYGASSINLFYGGSNKLQTTSSGVNVSGDMVVSQAGTTKLTIDNVIQNKSIELECTSLNNVLNAEGDMVFSSGSPIFKYTSSNFEVLSVDSTFGGIITVSGTGQSSFGGQVTIPLTPTSSTDAASKGYVDTQVGANNELSEVLANGNITDGTDIAVSAGDDITFTDTSKILLGDGDDLQIYHDGTDGYIDNSTGNLLINSKNADGDIKFYGDDGGSTSTEEYFRIDGGSGVTQFSNPLRFSDNNKAYFGDSNGLQIYNTGSDSWIVNTVGDLNINQSSGDVIITNANVGIGGSADNLLTLQGTAGSTHQRFKESSTTIGFIGGANGIISSHDGKLALRAE